jgi:hypothetical protein
MRFMCSSWTKIACTVVFDITHLSATSRTVKRLSPSITSRTSFFTTSEVLKDGLPSRLSSIKLSLPSENLTLECVTDRLMNVCVSVGVFPMSTQNFITALCSTLFENVFFSDDENSMHHYIFFSLIDVKFLDYDVIIFSAYSVIIFGINSLKSIAIYKICTLVFFIHNVKMWNPLYIVCYALHQNFTLISIFKILFIAIIRANWFYGFRN